MPAPSIHRRSSTSSVPPVINLRLPEYHPGQKRAREAMRKHRFVVAILGRRWGKTFLGVNEMAETGLQRPGSIQMWVAPTHDLATIAREEFHRLFQPVIRDWREAERRAVLINGARLYWRSADNPDSLIGRGFDRVIVDEAARVSDDAYKRAILPTLADRAGSLLAITTPKGKRGWVYELYQRALDEEPGYGYVKGPSTENPNPEIARYVADMKLTMPADIFAQEFLADPQDEAGAYFRGVDRCIGGTLGESGEPDKTYALGCDVAKYEDYTVVTALDEDSGQLEGYERFHRLDWGVQMVRISDFWKRWGQGRMIVDTTGVGDVVYDGLVERGVNVGPYKFDNRSKARLLLQLATAIEQETIRYPDIPELVEELKRFQYEILPSGTVRLGAPSGAHDDCVISLALAYEGVLHGTPGILKYMRDRAEKQRASLGDESEP